VKESARESVKVVAESARAVQISAKAAVQEPVQESMAVPGEAGKEEIRPEEGGLSLSETAFFRGVAIEDDTPSAPSEKPEEKAGKPEEGAEAADDTPFIPLQPERIQGTAINDKKPEEEAPKGKTRKRTTKKQVKLSEVLQEKQADMPAVNLSFANTEGNGRSNKEKILALYKEGKSNVAIAKELGLGVGEVKLIIDLFKGV